MPGHARGHDALLSNKSRAIIVPTVTEAFAISLAPIMTTAFVVFEEITSLTTDRIDLLIPVAESARALELSTETPRPYADYRLAHASFEDQ